ncbi:uncharacterized protein ABDE67_003269 [Symphorus nematophorus]
MMKLFLPLTLIWALSCTAGALQCQTCTNVACSSTVPVTCTSETSCITASVQVFISGVSRQQIFKACGLSVLCPATGTQTYSANFSIASAAATAQCCNTDNCNSATLNFPSAQTPNSLECFSCDPNTSQCTTRLQCSGLEDRCFRGSVTIQNNPIPYAGCASANLCAVAADSANLPILQGLGNITSEQSCCATSLCNAATSEARWIRQLTMIHLLLGLFVFTLC